MFMNRWLDRRTIVEDNELTAEEEAAVFAVLKPFQGEDGKERFLENQADAVVGWVRGGRPPVVEGLSLPTEASMKTTAVGEELVDRFFDRLAVMLDRFVPPDMASQQRMLTSDEAAEAMHLSSQTVVKWCREGKLTGSKVGRNWLVPREAVDAYIRRQQVVYGRSVK